jgi:two-component system chemotaxis response regulator CheY
MPVILVLDDSATMVMSLSHILKGAGYEVETGMNGREGITKLNDGIKPSVILTDLNMPELDGIGFIKEARKITSTRFTPIIVLTTESGGRKRDEARGSSPFVEVGATVGPDTTVCIIEVMKMMNSVAAGVSGTVVEVCAENGTLVEYGEPLLRVRPA